MQRQRVLPRRRLVPCLIAASALVSISTQAPAGIAPIESSQTHALVVTGPRSDAEQLERLSDSLETTYGVSPRRRVWLTHREAAANEIEREIGRLVNGDPTSTVLVIVDLELHQKGEEGILMAADFDPARPWTGLPIGHLEKLMLYGRAQNVWVFVPEACERPRGEKLSYFVQELMAQPRGRAFIRFCERSARSFTDLLPAAFEAAAALGVTREGPEGGASILADQLMRILQERQDDAYRVRADLSRGGGGMLRLLAVRSDARNLYARLVAADTVDTFVAELTGDVRSVLIAGDPEATASVSAQIERYALSEDMSRDYRALAVQALGGLPGDRSAAALLKVFEDSTDPALRRTVLSQWKAAFGNDLLTRALRDPDPSVQVAAIQSAARSKDKAHARNVLALFASPSADVRAAAARAVPELADRATAQPALLAALRDAESTVRLEAAGALGRLQASRAAFEPLLAAIVDDAWPRVQERSAYATSALWSELDAAQRRRLADTLLGLARSGRDTEVRAAALWSLGGSADPTLAASIAPIALAAPSCCAADAGGVPDAVRTAAATALGKLRGPESLRTLSALAGDARAPVALRAAAIKELGAFRGVAAADQLWLLSADPDSRLALSATQSLPGAGYSRAAAASLEDRKETPEARRIAAAAVLAGSADPAAVPALIGALDDPSAQVRERAIVGLATFTSPESLARLGAVLDRRARELASDLARRSAAQVLVRMGSARARAQLLAASTDPNVDVRAEVARGLGTRDVDAREYARLVELATDAAPRVRAAVATALGAVRSDAAGAVLERLSRDAHADVRAAAIEALKCVRANQPICDELARASAR